MRETDPTDPTEPAVATAILDAVLVHVAFEGWTDRAIRHGAMDLGLTAIDIVRAFPEGPADMIRFWSQRCDSAMLTALDGMDLAAMPVPDRLALALRRRIEAYAPHREAARRTMSYLALPANVEVGARNLYRTVDAVWYGIGDRSTDVSYYTKRASLAVVYAATLLYWIDDESEDWTDSWDFLERSLATLSVLPRLRTRLKQGGFSLPNPFAGLGRILSGSAPRGRTS